MADIVKDATFYRIKQIELAEAEYYKSLITALDRIDQALAQLRTLIKRGENKEALKFMEEGLLKERFEEMQNIITLSNTGTMGPRGIQNIRPL